MFVIILTKFRPGGKIGILPFWLSRNPLNPVKNRGKLFEGYLRVQCLPDSEASRMILRRKTYIYARVSTSKQKKDLEKFHCEIVVMSEIGSTKLDSQEIFEEIISLLHCYSMNYTANEKKKGSGRC